MASPPIRIVLVEDHAMFREGLAALLRLEPDLDVVASYGTGEEVLAHLDSDRPDMILLDVRLPGLGGEATLGQILARRPQQRVLMLTAQEGSDTIFRAIRAGAAGYILKKQPTTELVAAIRAGLTGTAPMAPEVAVEMTRRLTSTDLTARELEVLRKVARGQGNREIAAELGISYNTVRNHVADILVKLAAQDRTHAVTIAIRSGLIEV